MAHAPLYPDEVIATRLGVKVLHPHRIVAANPGTVWSLDTRGREKIHSTCMNQTPDCPLQIPVKTKLQMYSDRLLRKHFLLATCVLNYRTLFCQIFIRI